jgi:hypothetical protein
MLKLALVVAALVFTSSAAAAGWRDLRVDGSSDDAFAASLAVFKDKLPAARAFVFGEALKDIWARGSLAAAAGEAEYTPGDYYRQLHGLSYDEVVTLVDPTGEAAKARYISARRLTRPLPGPLPPSPTRASIGPYGEQVHGQHYNSFYD